VCDDNPLRDEVTHKMHDGGGCIGRRCLMHDEVLLKRTPLDSLQSKADIDIAIMSEVNDELPR
jgi:hypothetical protein